MANVSSASIEPLAVRYLTAAGAAPGNAKSVVSAMLRAEVEGNTVCGLFYLPLFREQLEAGKIDGNALPLIIQPKPGTVLVDACDGFAHPAIARALPLVANLAHANGLAAAAIQRSTNCLSLAHHVLPLAEAGLIGICVSNAPASVAPPGGTRPVFGTNPMAFAVPGSNGPEIVIDQSASAVTKTMIRMHADRGDPMPEGWAQDSSGRSTTNPEVGLAGSMLPFGGQKGANIGLIVEVLAAVLTGSRLSVDASTFFGPEGGPSHVGQFILAIDPAGFAEAAFQPGLERLVARFAEDGLRMPGTRFREQPSDDTIEIDDDLWSTLTAQL
ncbi:MAG: Ldh family oxidoreductase [Pseudomonadota bacterium]